MRRAREQDKNQLFRGMLARALRAGFRAAFVLADAWFGCKENIACCLEHGLSAIFQMKRGLLTYRYKGRPYNVYQLYALVQRRMRPANPRARFKTHRPRRCSWRSLRGTVPVGGTAEGRIPASQSP